MSKKKTEVTMGTKIVTIYRQTERSVPAVLMNSYMEAGDAILHSCEKHDCPAFQLVSISRLNWDEDLSPWPSEPVVSKEDHFTGGAKEYCAWIEDEVITYAEDNLPKITEWILAGYSMGGLFALYAPYISNVFSRCVCGSGSVWYPGFVEYAETTPFKRKPEAVYLSLGNKESDSSNPVLQTTGECMVRLNAFYESKGIPSVFQLNPGNHYQNVPQRMAKGMAWILRHQGETFS